MILRVHVFKITKYMAGTVYFKERLKLIIGQYSYGYHGGK
jgi:hypothetical protein